MIKTPTLLFTLACGCAFLAQPALSGTAPSTAPWVKLGGLPGSDLGRIAFDPNSPNTMLVGPGSGGGALFRSTNGGTSFTRLQVGGIDESFRAIAFDPKKNSGIAFAYSSDDVNGGTNGGVYESTNGGASWARLKNQPLAGTNHAGRGRSIVVDPTGTTVVAADASLGVFYSANLGVSWTNPLPSTSARVYALTQDPKSSTTLWAGGRDPSTASASSPGTGVLWKSTNTGKTWTEVAIPALNQDVGPLPLAIAILPNSNTVVFSWTGRDNNGNPFGGIITSNDGGKTWVNSSKGLPSSINPGNSIVVDPTTPTTLYLTTNGPEYPNTFYRSTDSGATWTSIGTVIGGGDFVFTAAARPAGTGVTAAVFAANQDLISSTNHGASWTVSANGTNSGVPIAIQDDLLAAGGIYAKSYNGLSHSTNNGQSWTRISTPWTGATAPRAFAVDPVAKTHTVYAATSSSFWQSANAGKTWTASALPTKTSDIQELIADKSVAGRVYAVNSNRTVYSSDNSGKTWTAGVGVGVTEDGFVTAPAAVVPDPTQAGTFYAGMISGVWKSTNSAAKWSELQSNDSLASIVAVAQSSATAIFAVDGQSSPAGFAYGVQKGVGAAKWTTVTNPYPENGGYPFFLAAGTSSLFAFGLDNSLMRSTNGGTSWGVVDGTIESSILTTNVVSVTAANVYVGDQRTDAAFTAAQASLTGGASTARPAATRHSAVRPGQLARHIAE